MTPPSEQQKMQNISGSLSVVTSIGHLIKHYHKQGQKQSEIHQMKC